MESQVLVLRKEVKVALAAAAGVVGIALVYGLMATLSSSPSDSPVDPLAHQAGDSVGTLDVSGGADQIVSGLPPKEDAPVAGADDSLASATDPFAESARTDGRNIDWAAVLSSGRVPVDATPALAGPRVQETGTTGPASANSGLITTRTPSYTAETTAADTGSTASDGTIAYVVQPGDNFSRIAGKVYGNKNLYKIIVDANPNVDPTRLKPGMTINVPARDKVPTATADTRNSIDFSARAAETIGTIDANKQYVIKPGDTLHKISLRLYGKSNRWSSIYDLNREKIGPDAGRLKVGTVLTLPEPPISGTR